MKLLAFLGLALSVRALQTPNDCTALNTDSNFPSLAEWQAALPGIAPNKNSIYGYARPDYRFRAKSARDVEKAVQFATKHNIRLTIINTGHDYQGRNDAPSGLSLDVSQLRGVRVSSSFEPSVNGMKSPIPGKSVEILEKIDGKQPVVTFGAGIVGSELNKVLKPNKLFAVTGGAATVSVAGGWGQTSGHSYVSHMYGLGADQFLEFKVVTADGKLKVANNISNPDLFWALRGGGGGSWGVVTEATVKTYPSPPTVLHLFYINSSTASLESYMNNTDGSDARGLYDAIAYFGSQIPTLVHQGAGGIFLSLPYGLLGASVFVGENATRTYAKSVWDPVLNKMKSFKGMDGWIYNTKSFPMYQDFFSYIWPTVGISTGGSGTGESARYGLLFKKFLDENMVSKADMDLHMRYLYNEIQKRDPQVQQPTGLSEPASQGPYGSFDLSAFSGLSELSSITQGLGASLTGISTLNSGQNGYQPYTWDDDFDVPTPHGKYPMDNWLLSKDHLEKLPSASPLVKRWFGSRFIMEIVAGPKTHSMPHIAVLPAWRKTYLSCYMPYLPPYINANILREYAPDSGAYVNEAFYEAKNWKEAFWGTNYPRLSDIKSKWDPNNTFWVSPGINADKMEVRNGRVCKNQKPESLNGFPPKSDNPNMMNFMANLKDLLALGVPYGGQ